MIFLIVGYILIFIVVIALCKAAARADKKFEEVDKEINKDDGMNNINYKE
ncbi:MAG: hypothetical protein ACRDAU_18080 [Clostridium sp.]